TSFWRTDAASSSPRSINKNPVAATYIRLPRDLVLLLELRLRFCRANAILQRPHREVRLLLINQERWREPNRIFTGAENQQPLVEGCVHNGIPQIGCFLFGPLISHDLDADHQPAPAHIADN